LRSGGKPTISWTEFEHHTDIREQMAAAKGRDAVRTSWLMIYPLTLLECALMTIVSVYAWIQWRIVYCSWWYPENSRQRPDRLIKPKIDVQDAMAAMRTIEDIARESGARIFWISGTLLGLERHGHPLPHDKDLDVGISIDDPHCMDFIRALWASNRIGSMKPQFISKKTRMQNPDLRCIPAGIVRYMAGVGADGSAGESQVKLDVFLHFPYSGGVVHGTRNSLWWNSAPAVMQKTYGKASFGVPQDVHLYLTENYGNYQDEVREFENSIDCPNAMDVFSWKSWTYLLTRQRMMLRLGRVARARLVNRRLRSTILKGLFPLAERRSRVQRG
jgi:hypothetical protein